MVAATNNNKTLIDRINALEKSAKQVRKQTTWAEIGVLWGIYLVTVAIPPTVATVNHVRYQWEQVSQSRAAQWLGLAGEGGKGGGDTLSTADGEKIAATALAWAGKDFKPGQTERCADFVRHVLEEAGVTVGVAKGSAGPLMADSFHGEELGEIILNKNKLQPGDLVMFADTYNGPGRAPIRGRGRITHVGIYIGNGQIVDRPTAAKPVQKRSVDTFKFHSALRISSPESGDFVSRYVAAVARKESGSNYNAVNPDSGALGKFQFMPATMKSTALNCPSVGFQPTTQEFLARPDLQDKVMSCYVEGKLNTIQAKASDAYTQCRMLASTHYSGNPDNYNNGKRQFYNGREYPSIADYTKDVCKGF